ncbi:uncharacterized protein LOC106866105 [Brachypodium distachyon]|uniref:uncharacterized protein LOC106866105 n=1 Tax=Brachypodium distachyon TaxID=15368 RepID=UPI0006E47B95|nr:uncharacterized protein LOC106866105 [Brachypodium distachyon]|eukprot:XP_014754261.1 uncharacterized protein LOC106866105 [Brachypodium distachyon]
MARSTPSTSGEPPPCAGPSSGSKTIQAAVASPSTPPATASSSCPSGTTASTSATRPRAPGSDRRRRRRSAPSPPLRLYSRHTGRNCDSTVFHVLTVSFSGAPRCIGLPVASPAMKELPNQWFIRACTHRPVLLHDCLHWHLGSNFFDGKVLVFDTLVESFRLMQSPIANRSVRLLEIDGTLGISHIDYATTMAELWVLRDYKMEVWSLKYRVVLSVAETREHFRMGSLL